MIRIIYYIYFGIYVLVKTIAASVNAFLLRRKSSEAADEYMFKTIQGMARHLLRLSESKLEIKGLENIPKEPCVFVSNHQAIFDTILLVSNIDKQVGFIAKKELEHTPFIGFWIKAIHSVFIDRSNVREGMKAINEGVERIKEGYSLIIFPEGTRSLSSEMGGFKKGSMKLAIKAGAPIVPVTIDGTYRVLETGNHMKGNLLKMTVHKPIVISQLSDQDKKNLSELIYGIIKKAL
ncbi:MAG: lysophospholipid acyltransferase family protein [Clostridiaceae bacterium]